MKAIKFGIDFIDNHLLSLPETGIYLFSSSNSVLFSIFLSKLIQNNLDRPILFISSLELFFRNTHDFESILALKNHKNMSILEIPLNINEYIVSGADLNHLIDDLDLYIVNLQPKLLVIENFEFLVSKDKGSISWTHVSSFFNYLWSLDIAVILDSTNFDKKALQVCEKYIEGIFEFYTNEASDFYQIVLNKCRAIGNKKLTLSFSLDMDNNVLPPINKNAIAIRFEECKQIVLHSTLAWCESMFSEIFNTSLQFLYFDKESEFTDLPIDYKYSLIILPAHLQGFNGWRALSWVHRNYPFSKILFSGSIHTPASQKVRSIKMGADKFIVYPFDKKQLSTALSSIYIYDAESVGNDLQHTVVHSSGAMVKSYQQKIYKNVLLREIKEFAFTLVQQGFTMHFFKVAISPTAVDKMPSDIREHPHFVFASRYFIDNRHTLLMIFTGLNHGENHKIIDRISLIANVSTNKVESLTFPLDEVNMDLVLDWIYL